MTSASKPKKILSTLVSVIPETKTEHDPQWTKTKNLFEKEVWPSFVGLLKQLGLTVKISESTISSDIIKTRNAQTQPQEYYQRWEIQDQINCSLFVLTRIEKKKLNFTFLYTENKLYPDRVLWSSFLAIPLANQQKSQQIVQALLRSWKQMNFSYVTRIRMLDIFQFRASASDSDPVKSKNLNEAILLIYPSPSILVYDETQEKTQVIPDEITVFPSPQILKKDKNWPNYFDPFLENSQTQSCILLAQNTLLNHIREVKFFTSFPAFSPQIKENQKKNTTIYVATDLQIKFHYVQSKLDKTTKIEVLARDRLVWPVELQAFLKIWERKPKVSVKWTGINCVLKKFFLPRKDSSKQTWCSVQPSGAASSLDFYGYLIKFAKTLSETNAVSFLDNDFLRGDKKKIPYPPPPKVGSSFSPDLQTTTSSSSALPPHDPQPDLQTSTSSSSSALPPHDPQPDLQTPTQSSAPQSSTPSSSTVSTNVVNEDEEEEDLLELETLEKFKKWTFDQIKSWLCLVTSQESENAEKKLWEWWLEVVGNGLIDYFLKSLQIQYEVLLEQSSTGEKKNFLSLLRFKNQSLSFQQFPLVARKAFQLRLYGIPLTLLDIFLITRDLIYTREHSTFQIAFLPEIYSYGIHLGISLHKIDQKPQLQQSETARAPSNPEISSIPIAFLIEKMPVVPHFRHILLQNVVLNWYKQDWAIWWFNLLVNVISFLDDIMNSTTSIEDAKVAEWFGEKYQDFFDALQTRKEKLKLNVQPNQSDSQKWLSSRIEYATNLTENAFGLLHKEKKGSSPFFFFKLTPFQARLIAETKKVWEFPEEPKGVLANWTQAHDIAEFNKIIDEIKFLEQIYNIYREYKEKLHSQTQ